MIGEYVPGLYPSKRKPVYQASGISGIREAVRQGKMQQELKKLKKECEALERQLPPRK